MTSRSTSLRYPEGTKTVGTARVREDKTVGRSFAERELMRRTGNAPHSTFDEVADGFDGATAGPVSIAKSVETSAKTAAQIGQPAPLGKAIKRLTKPAGPAKKPKYGNQKCESGGVKFDSKREMMRWHDLVIMQTRGEISELELQVPFVLAPAVVIDGRKRPALRYVADFVYVKAGEDSQTVEDVKGRVTEGYRIKRHLMAARGITIKEIK
jgi:Protein of unknown function (DUF1064).